MNLRWVSRKNPLDFFFRSMCFLKAQDLMVNQQRLEHAVGSGRPSSDARARVEERAAVPCDTSQ